MSRTTREEKPGEIFSELALEIIHERTHANLIGIVDPFPGGMLMAFLWAAGNIIDRVVRDEQDDS